MRILIVTATYLPTVNGVAISLSRQKAELEKRGHSITLLAPKHPNQAKEKGVIRLPSIYNPVYPDYPILLPIPTIHNLKIFKQKFDLVYFHHPFYVGDFALNLAKYFNCPAIFFYHSRYEKGARLHFAKLVPNFLITYFVDKSVQKLANQANQIIVETPSIKQELKNKKINTEINVIPSVGKQMLAKISKHKLRRKYNLNLNETIMLSVVRLSKEKNLYSLLRIFSRFRQNPNLTLLLAGDGPIKEDLIKFAKRLKIWEKIRFLGTINYNRLSELYSLSDVFVHPGKLETQAIVILEAMSAGLPVVAFNRPGPKDFIFNGTNGILVSNEKEFITKLGYLIEKKELRIKMGKSAKETSGKFTPENSIALLENLLEKTALKKQSASSI